MKNIILTLSLFLVATVGFTQKDTVRIKHTNYTTVFDKTKRYPVMVEWWVTKKMVSCPTPLKRKDNFKPDPQLVDETNIAFYY